MISVQYVRQSFSFFGGFPGHSIPKLFGGQGNDRRLDRCRDVHRQPKCNQHQARLRQMTCQSSVGTAPVHRSKDTEASPIARIHCTTFDKWMKIRLYTRSYQDSVRMTPVLNAEGQRISYAEDKQDNQRTAMKKALECLPTYNGKHCDTYTTVPEGSDF